MAAPLKKRARSCLPSVPKKTADPTVVEIVGAACIVGKHHLDAFMKEYLIERNNSVNYIVHGNEAPLFGCSTPKAVARAKTLLAVVRSDVELFSRWHIGCHSRGGYMDEFIRRENQTSSSLRGREITLGHHE